VFGRTVLPSITPAEVADGTFILDVRELGEWDAGHPPAAHHIPMMTLPGRLDELPTDETIVVLCRHGHRSAQVVNYLIAHGYTNALNLDGGIVDWVTAGRPIVTDDGSDPYIA
jgi:rhodanese-related sulfurtransferase